MSREMYLLQSFILLLSISIICKSQTTTSVPCIPPPFCACQPVLSKVCCADGITYDNQCSADCKCQFNCQQGACVTTTTTTDPTEIPTSIPTSVPTEPTTRPSTDPTGFPTTDPTETITTIQTTKTDIGECFIRSKCDTSDDCCPDSVDERSIGVKCMKKKKKKKRRSSDSRSKTKNFCCIKKGFSGCVLDKDCCPNKHGKKGICSSENICVSKGKHSNDNSNYNALVNEEEIDDTSNMSLNTFDKFDSNTKWIICGVLIGFIIMLCVLCYVCIRGVAFNKYSNVRNQINDDKDVLEDRSEQMEEGCSNGKCNVIDYGVVSTQEHD